MIVGWADPRAGPDDPRARTRASGRWLLVFPIVLFPVHLATRTSSTAATCCRSCRSSRCWPRRRWSRRQPAAALRDSAAGPKRADRRAGAARRRAAGLHLDRLRRRRSQGVDDGAGVRLDRAGGARAARRSPSRSLACSLPADYRAELRQAAAARRRSRATRHPAPAIWSLRRRCYGLYLANPRTYPDEYRATTSGSFGRPRRSRASRRRRTIPARSCRILKVNP